MEEVVSDEVLAHGRPCPHDGDYVAVADQYKCDDCGEMFESYLAMWPHGARR